MFCNKIKKSWLKLKVRVTAPSYANFIFLLNVNQYFNRPQEGKTPQNIQHTQRLVLVFWSKQQLYVNGKTLRLTHAVCFVSLKFNRNISSN